MIAFGLRLRDPAGLLPQGVWMTGLFGSSVLEVGIGLVFVYLLLSLSISVINELIAQAFALRAATLEQGLRRLLDGTTRVSPNASLATRLLSHPLIAGLSSTTGPSRPSYIPPHQFALALLDVVAPDADPSSPNYWKQVRDEVQKIQNEHARDALTTLIDHSRRDVDVLRHNIEVWFNDAMDRVSGWYRRKVRKIVLALGLILTLAVNADTLGVAMALWNGPTLRAGVVSAVQDYTTHLAPQAVPNVATEVDQIASALSASESSRLPLGWSQVPSTPADWLREVVGLLLTAVAVSLGAPFWFDVLNKFMAFRSTGPPPPAPTAPPGAGT